MINLTDHLLQTAPDLDATFRAGVDSARAGVYPRADFDVVRAIRALHGFQSKVAPLLTPPDANHKLDGASVPSYGLTLYHFRSVMPERGRSAPRLSINACPSAGHCVKVCVLNNGHGRWDSTKRAWLWRTELVARHPESFARILAWELVKAQRKHGAILFRPNVNSDVAWQRVLPSLTDGYVSGVTSYGYSKLPETLDGDGWLGSTYRVAYSWNERSDAERVSAFLARGGAVAVVSSRRKGASVTDALPFDVGPAWPLGHVVDADSSDEWMLASSVVGDLSAKGKARELIGKSKFVVTAITA